MTDKKPEDEKKCPTCGQTREAKEDEDQIVTPWEVSAEKGIDYDKLITKFGSQRIDQVRLCLLLFVFVSVAVVWCYSLCAVVAQALIDRIERVTKKPVHHWLRRGLFFSHRSALLRFFPV